jgi:hypothetical protein
MATTEPSVLVFTLLGDRRIELPLASWPAFLKRQ